jgi:hypothetical protein
MGSNLVNNSSASVSGPQEQSQHERRSLVLRDDKGGTPGDVATCQPAFGSRTRACVRGVAIAIRHHPVIIIIIIFNLSS